MNKKATQTCPQVKTLCPHSQIRFYLSLVQAGKYRVRDFIDAKYSGTELFEADLFPFEDLQDFLGLEDIMFQFESGDMFKMETFRKMTTVHTRKSLSLHEFEEARQIPEFLNQQYLKEIKILGDMRKDMQDTMVKPWAVYDDLSETVDVEVTSK